MPHTIIYSALMIQDFYTVGSLVSPKSLVFFLHGYGGNAENVRSIATYWAPQLPDTLFILPNGPTPHSYDGYEWFHFPELSSRVVEKGISYVHPLLSLFIKHQQEKYHIGREKTILAGFSQGALTALSIGLLEPQLATGVISYSGGLFIDNEWMVPSPQDTSILFVHGTEDTIVSPQLSEKACAFLNHHGVTSRLHLIPDLEHSIDQEGLDVGTSFIKSLISLDHT